MVTFVGPVWRDGRPTEGWARIEGGRVVDEGEGTRPGTAAVLLDGVHNFHTHLGDAFLRGRRLPRRLEDLVRPVTGYKHRMLAAATHATIVNGIRRALALHAAAGTRTLLDFREQGVLGLRLAHRAVSAARGDAPAAAWLGRPQRLAPAPAETEALLEAGDGMGLPSLSDVGEDALEAAARACRRAKAPFVLHVSERRREDLDRILDLRPALVVHGCAMRPTDAKRLAEENVPIALCPRSNAFFRLPTPIGLFERYGVRWYLGTDNAMLGGTSLIDEAEKAKRLAPELSDAALLRALTTPPEKAINPLRPLDRGAKAPERLLVLPRRGKRVGWRGPVRVASR